MAVYGVSATTKKGQGHSLRKDAEFGHIFILIPDHIFKVKSIKFAMKVLLDGLFSKNFDFVEFRKFEILAFLRLIVEIKFW